MATKRLIDANELLELYDMGKELEEYAGLLSVPITVIRQNIKDMPTVDAVEVVHGQWIEKPYLLGTTRYCSICGQNYGMPHGVFNYCPNCGAKMKGE